MKSLTLSSTTTDSWLSRCDPRLRVIAALLFVALCVSLQQPVALMSALLLSLLFAFTIGIKPELLLQRLIAVEGFMLVLLLTLPFSIVGQTWFQLGPLTASIEGSLRALEILLKANAVVIILLALIGTLEPVVLGHAMARLGVPEKLVHLFLFTARYIGVFMNEYQRLRLAMRARGFTPTSNRHTWRSFGDLIGMLLVRSLERSQRILTAMKCRGFNNRLFLVDTSHWQSRDSLLLLLWMLPLAGLIALELST